MNQEPTQSQIDLLLNAIEEIYVGVPIPVRRHSFGDIIVKAFVGEYHGEDYVFVALKVDKCSERDLPWICWSNHNEEWWENTDGVETETGFCMVNMMIDVSEQAKTIYSTFLF